VTWVVLDIEGTLAPTAEVLVTLYDYARPRLGPWIDDHPADPAVADAVAAVRKEAGLAADAGTAEVVAVLHEWMAADRKAVPLKTLQGLVWQHGYAAGELTFGLFPDVVPALRAARQAGRRLAVFSSGSVAGQVAAFSRTSDGDVRDLFEHHFDPTTAGPKRSAEAYEAIAAVLGATPVFLSDVPAELDAAAAAGWATVGVVRPGEPAEGFDFGAHRTVATLAGFGW
jgi:enolase-phosphatase E1